MHHDPDFHSDGYFVVGIVSNQKLYSFLGLATHNTATCYPTMTKIVMTSKPLIPMSSGGKLYKPEARVF